MNREIELSGIRYVMSTTCQLFDSSRSIITNSMTSSIFVVLIVILFANHHIFVCTTTTNLTVKQTEITYQNKTRKPNTTN